jgi:hypothetical protein
MTMRDECMAPNRKQRASILQMNVVDRQIDQKVRLLRLEKFAADRNRATERMAGANGAGRTGESDEHKKRYSTMLS